MDDPLLPLLHFDRNLEGRRGFAFEDGFLGCTATCFIIAEGDGLDAAD
jgi:hypothetical protein